MFRIEFATDNAAFEDAPVTEIEAIFARIAGAVAVCQDGGRIMDSNGNHVGDWSANAAPPPVVLVSDDVATVCGFVDGFTSGGSEAFDSDEAQEAMAEAVERLSGARTVSPGDLAAVLDFAEAMAPAEFTPAEYEGAAAVDAAARRLRAVLA